jgi:hypothetical protein
MGWGLQEVQGEGEGKSETEDSEEKGREAETDEMGTPLSRT